MIETKDSLSEYGDVFDYTPEELRAISMYTGEQYKEFNALLTNDGGAYEKFAGVRLTVQDIENVMNQLPLVYSAMVKSTAQRTKAERRMKLVRGTSIAEAESLMRGKVNARLTSASREYEELESGGRRQSNVMSFATKNSIPALVEFWLGGKDDVMTFDVADLADLTDFSVRGQEQEIIIQPFVKARSARNAGMTSWNGVKCVKYVMSLEREELRSMPKEEQEVLRARLLEEAPQILIDIQRLVNWDDEKKYAEESVQIQEGKLRENVEEFLALTEVHQEMELNELILLWKDSIDSVDFENGHIALQQYADRFEAFKIKPTENGYEYNRDLEEQIMKAISTRILALEIFSRASGKPNLERENKLAQLYEMILTYGEIGGERYPYPFTGVLESTYQYLKSSIGNNELVDYGQDSTVIARKIRDNKEEREYIEGVLAEKQAEHEEKSGGRETIEERVSEWKRSFARLCMARCRDIELGIENGVKLLEASPQVVEKIEPPSITQSESTEENKPKEEQMQRLQKVASSIIEQFSPANLVPANNARWSLENAERRSMRVVQEIRNLTRMHYDNRVNAYRPALNLMCNQLENVPRAGSDTIESGIIDGVAHNIEELFGELKPEQIATEVDNVVRTDENLLKKLVFERFCVTAINAETGSLRKEADGIRAQEAKRGVARLVAGPSKQAVQRRRNIDEFLAVTSVSPARPGYRGVKYSYNDIVADMEIFMEDYEKNPDYARAVAEVQELKDVLSSYFGTRDRMYLDELKENKRRAQRRK